MLQKVQKTLEELNMVSSQDLILVGVSGGADSVCLLLMLKELECIIGYKVEAVHVEHGIRGQESLEDAAFVENLCARMQIPCNRVSVHVPAYSAETGIGTEEAARILRYEAFAQIAKEKQAKVALAHHMEDNAETILFQLVRGSSLTGLCGMQSVREDEAGIVYIRPLLSMHRAEIEDYLRSRGINWRVDSTNHELEYSRNYLRNVVLPQLLQVNEQAVEHINGTANRLQDVRDFLEQETIEAWTKVVSTDVKVVAQKKSESEKVRALSVDIRALADLHPAIQKELMLKAISTVCGSRKDITAVHIEDVLSLCQKQSGREVCLPYQVVAKRDFDKIYVYSMANGCTEEAGQSEGLTITVSAEALERILDSGKELEVSLKQEEGLRIKVFSYDAQSMQIPKKTYTKWLDYDKIKQGFCIRTRRSGDYFIGDALGHHKKLKNYFIDEKISAVEREQMWLLAQDSLVLWIIGGRISEHVKVTEDTQTIVEIEYIGGNKNGFY